LLSRAGFAETSQALSELNRVILVVWRFGLLTWKIEFS
jgi:hypothetical protein